MENKVYPTDECAVCHARMKEGSPVEIPLADFPGLEGDPFICERCMAKSFGLDIPWKEEIENNLKEKEI